MRLRARHGKIRERAAKRGKEKHTTREQMREIHDETKNFCAACGAVPARGLRGQNGAGRAGR